jgi:hypothetical protein
MRDLSRLTDSVGERPPGSDGERVAAEIVAEQLTRRSIPNTMLPFKTVRGIATIFLVPFVLLLLSIPAAYLFPLGGLIVATIAALVTALEATNRPVISRVFRLDGSQNVIGLVPHRPQSGDEDEEPHRRVIITAHLDSPRRGWLDTRTMIQLSRVLTILVMICVAGVPVVLAIHLFINSALTLIAAAIPGIVVLLALAFLMQRDLLGNLEPGRNSNASGIFTALALAEELKRYPPLTVETLFLFTGASQAGSAGLINFLSSNKFNPETTYFVNIESVGRSPICFTRAEGPVLALESSPGLVHIAGDIALSHPERLMRPVIRRGVPSEQYPALIRGYQAITISGHPDPDTVTGPPGMVENDEIDPDAIDSAFLLALGIIRRLDEEAVAGRFQW